MLEELAKYRTSKEAAKAFAGNWMKWQSFVWFGANDVPNSHNMALGYVVSKFDYSAKDVANLRALKKHLAEYWGDSTKGADIDDFGSSFWGDKGMFEGLQVRVIGDDGKVTKAFQYLWALARKAQRDEHIDEDIYKATNRELLRGLVANTVDDQRPEFIDAVTDCLIDEEGKSYDDIDYGGEDCDIERVASEVSV
jgi:hypothetical protein